MSEVEVLVCFDKYCAKPATHHVSWLGRNVPYCAGCVEKAVAIARALGMTGEAVLIVQAPIVQEPINYLKATFLVLWGHGERTEGGKQAFATFKEADAFAVEQRENGAAWTNTYQLVTVRDDDAVSGRR